MLWKAAAASGIEDEVAGIRGDAREDADQHDDERDQPARRRPDEQPDERPDQPGLLGQPDAEHRDEDDPDDAEVVEVGDRRRDHEADAVGGQQALDRRGLGLDFHVLGVGTSSTGTCGTSTALPGG